ncbi:MAG: hypothetical protein ACK4ND_19045 [Cytophagaceae bacterium]
MKRFLYRITPSFVHRINDNLLKNDVLGWQLQLPSILWLWFLISLITLPVALIYPLDVVGTSDKIGVRSIAIITTVLQFFLYGFILIQFNSTKLFGKKTFLHGLKEQLAYFLVMFLCFTNVILFPLVIDIRKTDFFSDETIVNEQITYNKARHYFMEYSSQYHYFPDGKYFQTYMEMTPSDSGRFRNRYEYYGEIVKPLIAPYLSDVDQVNLDSRYATRTDSVPQFYYTEDDYVSDFMYYKINPDIYNKAGYPLDYNYSLCQLHNKSDNERLEEIKEFISLFKKYQTLRNPYWKTVTFKSPEDILKNYHSNRFASSVYEKKEYDRYAHIQNEVVSNVHSNILSSKYNKWRNAGVSAGVSFHIAIVLCILIFIFKNVRLRPFILSFVYLGLLIFIISIITILTNTKDFFAVHVPLGIFFLGLFYVFRVKSWNHYSQNKTIISIYTNMAFAYAPLFFFFYLSGYLNLWELPYEYCKVNPQICDERRLVLDTIREALVWGGPVLYLFLGSFIFKRFYNIVLSLPLLK